MYTFIGKSLGFGIPYFQCFPIPGEGVKVVDIVEKGGINKIVVDIS
jgi:hypothetical protein